MRGEGGGEGRGGRGSFWIRTDALRDVSCSRQVPGEADRTELTAGGTSLVLVLTHRTQHALTVLLLTTRRTLH